MFQENAAGSVRAFSTSMFQSCGSVTVCAQRSINIANKNGPSSGGVSAEREV